MEILKLFALITALSLLLCGCSPTDASALEYQNSSFSAHISWSIGNVKAKALLSSSPDESGTRNITLTFDSPPSLKGLTLTKNGDSISSSFGHLEILGSYAGSLIEITDFFSIDGTLKKSYTSEIDTKKFNCVEFLSDNGNLYTVYLNPQSALPRRICGSLGDENIILEVLEFFPT